MKSKQNKPTRPNAYARAGVDVDLGNRLKQGLPKLLASTHRPEVLGEVGGFGGLFALNVKKYRQPVLVSSVDGVGTKLKVAFALNRHDTIGRDLVNHCVNDIAVLGAEPLFFLDYLGTGQLEPEIFSQILKGFARGCRDNGCALIGGETAQMPGFYQSGEYDVSGTIVGVVEKKRMITGKTIRPGDAVIGLGSSGLHTNGYSLARRIFFQQWKWKPTRYVADFGRTIGEELLAVHRTYSPLIQSLLRRFPAVSCLKGIAHITGGGFSDNIPRVLPDHCDAALRIGSWEMPPIFQLLQAKSGMDENELYRVFNMGIGMVLIVRADDAAAVLKSIRARRHKAWLIGEILRGKGSVRLH